MVIFNSMEELRKKGYHIGKFEEIFTIEEIEFLKKISDNIINEFKNTDNVECKTQHTGNHCYPFYDYKETYIHPYNDIPKVDKFMEENGYQIFQRWKQLLNNVQFEGNNQLANLIEKVKLNIINGLYGEFSLQKEDLDLGRWGTIGMYEKGDKQPPHFDAGSERTLFGCIFYLTPEEKWSDGKGGEFLINYTNEKIPPVFGNYVVLDFVDNLIEHQVLELLEDFRRYTLISFPSIIKNGNDSTTNFLEYKKNKKVFTP